jgi:hypothetical protein
MEFECVLASCDPEVLRMFNRSLLDLAIATKICFHASQAHRAIAQGSTDLIIIDLVDEPSMELLREIWKRGTREKPTIVGISSTDHHIPGVHLKVRKPLTAESSLKALKMAYTRMLMDYRRQARHALMISVMAIDDLNCEIPVTVMDVGYGGVGLRLRHKARIGQVVCFSLRLPGAKKSIHIEARVIWKRDFGRVGCEFVRIPPVDLSIFHDWLRENIVIKQPKITV